MSSSYLRHGGIGSSGIGGYHGTFSFEAFTHPFCIAYRPLGGHWDLGNLRCHPYTPFKRSILEGLILKVPHVPVLHVGKVFKFLVAVLLLKLFLVDGCGIAVRALLADILEPVVDFLRK